MKKKSNVGTYILLCVMLFIVIFPFICMVLNSFRSNEEIMSSVSVIPQAPTLENYIYVFEHTNFLNNMLNSLIVAVVVTLINTICAALSAYALSRYKGKGFNLFKLLTYAFQMIPVILLLNPLFMIINNFGLYDNLAALVITYTAISLPLAIWTLKGIFDTISFEIEESALIDGCGRFRTFSRIIVPIAKPGIFTAGILTFNYAWNEYMLSSIFVVSEETKTLTTGIQQFASSNNVEWGAMMTAATIAALPAFLLIIFAQKYIVQGMSAGAVKG